VLAGALAALGAGRLLGVLELFVLGAVAIALVVVSVAWVRRPLPALALHREVHPARPTRGAAARVDVVVRNRGRRPTPVLTVRDVVEGTVGARLAIAPLEAGSARQVGYRLPTLRRGALQVGPMTAELLDPFGLARRAVGGPEAQTITILPGIEPLEGRLVGAGRQEPLAGRSTRSMATSGIEDLATLRPYVVGDDLRRVHWPASARADDLLVRRDEERWQGHLTLVLDVDPAAMGAAAFEQAVSAAASIVHHVAESGDRVRLVASDGYDSGMVDARRAEGALLEHLAHLAQAPTELALPTAPSDRRSSLVVLSGAQRAARAGALLRGDEQATGWVVRFGGPSTTAGPDGPGGLAVGAGDRFAERWRHLAGRRAEART